MMDASETPLEVRGNDSKTGTHATPAKGLSSSSYSAPSTSTQSPSSSTPPYAFATDLLGAFAVVKKKVRD